MFTRFCSREYIYPPSFNFYVSLLPLGIYETVLLYVEREVAFYFLVVRHKRALWSQSPLTLPSK